MAVGVAFLAAAAVLGLVGVQVARLVGEASVTTVTQTALAPAAASARPFHEPAPPRPETYSNVYRYDYVGPETCRRCHAANYELWRTHPHSKMNRNPTAATVIGDFSESKLVYGDETAVFFKDHGELGIRVDRKGAPGRQYKVTRLVGSRFILHYIGVQVLGPEPAGNPVYAEEVKLPFGYWIDRHEWFPELYDETMPTSEYDEKGNLSPSYFLDVRLSMQWKRVCTKCHNTYPYVLRAAAGNHDKITGFPSGDLEIEPAPRLSPGSGGLPEVETWDLVTMGISCESCHFGGREHAESGARISFLPRGEAVRFVKAPPAGSPDGRSPYAVNSICHQCHAADPQGPLFPDGSASWNGREAADLIGGACASAIACTDCHNPHRPGPTEVTTADAPNHLAACVRCHAKLRAPADAAAHAGHPAGVKVSCLDCHMPRIVHGLSSTTRSHRISSPTDPRMIESDQPNACNLCHLDRSIRWTLDAIASKWGKRPAMGPGFAPSAEPLGRVWLHHKEAVIRQVAAAAYARLPLGKAAFAEVLPILNDPSPPARMLGVVSVEALLGRPITLDEYTPWAAPAARAQQVAELGRRAGL